MARSWAEGKVAVVTGANKGIGFEIVKGLLKNGVTTVLAARDAGRGTKAVESLHSQGLHSAVFHPLEITNAESLAHFSAWLNETYGGLDILVNNAAISKEEETFAAAKETMDTNYFGTKAVTDELLPLMRPGGRIVNIGSLLGKLSYLGSPSLASALGNVDRLSEEFVDSYVAKFLDDVKAGRRKEEGWAKEYLNYTDSKILLHAYTRALAKTLAERPPDRTIYANVVHPGYIKTDMNNNAGPGTPEEGADTPVWLSLLPENDYPNGELFFNRKHMDW